MSALITVSGSVRSVQAIIHSSNTADEGVLAQGNQIFHRKLKVYYRNEPVLIPVISGNSIRGIMRRLGAQSFLSLLELEPDNLDKKLHYLLFSGGALERGAARGKRKSNAEDSSSDADCSPEELRKHIPLVSLFGCSYRQQMLRGKLIVDFLVPYVDEVAELYGREKPGIRAGEISDWLFYTRNDDNQMIYQLEYILPNIEFMHSFTLMGTSEVETALFIHLLEELRRFGHVGGKIAQGHGKVEFHYDINGDLSAAPYFRYVLENKEAILTLLKTYW